MRTASILFFTSLSMRVLAQDVFVVTPLPTHPVGEDFAPVPYRDGILYCSLRETEGMIQHVDASTGKPLSDLYWSPLSPNGLGKPTLLSPVLASPVNEGPAGLCCGDQVIIYTRNSTVPKRLRNINAAKDVLGLFLSERNGEGWSEPTPFPHNSDQYSLMHPSLSEDGNTLLFASNMPGGYGGTDLYRCHKENGSWGSPKNLGSAVNGPGNELFPFLHGNGRLYFSAERPGGSGGLDILRCEPRGSGFSAPEFLPAPINSSGNDIGFTIDPEERIGYFSSDRSGTDMIHRAKRTVPPFADCVPQVPNNYCFHFTEKPLLSMKGLPVVPRWTLGLETTREGWTAQHCFPGPGTYAVRLELIDTLTNDVFFTQVDRTFVVERPEQPFILTADTVRTGRTFLLDATTSHLPGMEILEYQWSLGDGAEQEGERIEHSFSQQGTYSIKLQAIGRPDAQGAIPSACVSYDIVVLDRWKEHEQGVLIVYQDANGATREFSYQELPFDPYELTLVENGDVVFSVELLASEERVGLNDPRFIAVRQLYAITERYDPVRAVYAYSVGEARTLGEMYDIYRKLKELQFLDAEVVAMHPERLTDMSSLAFMNAQELNNSMIRTSNVYFATGEYSIEEEYLSTLSALVEVLDRNPELELVVEAHTDDRGTDENNELLSQRRATTIKDHFLGQGIELDRVVAVGFGEHRPIASNKNESGRQQNRRVEFRLTLKQEYQANVIGQ